MQVTVLGSSGSYPVPGRPSSGFLITAGPTRVWCDAGSGTFSALGLHVSPDEVTAVVLSHRHVDHCVDVLAAFHAWAYRPEPRRGVLLVAPASVFEALVSFLGAGTDHPFFDVFTPRPVEGGDRETIGGLEVAFFETDHSVPTVASRWSDGARTLAYSADTGPAGGWMEVAADADLFLCEATYQTDAAADYPHHLRAAEAGRIAREVGARCLMLTHVPPHLDPARSVEEAEATFGREVALAVPRTTHKV